MRGKLDDLLGELRAAGPRGPGRRYPRALRERMVAWANRERRRGRRWQEIATELGVRSATLTRWCGEPPEFVPVVVQAEVSGEGVALVSPTGWRIEGLSLTKALEVMRSVAC